MHFTGILVVVSLLFLPSLAGAETVATVAGEQISREELERSVRPQLIEVENNRYEILEQGLNEMVAEKLMEKEAQARGVSVEQLRTTEIEGKITPPTEEEAKALFDSNSGQLGGQSFDDLKPRIIAYLANQRAGQRAQEYLEELKKKYTTTIVLSAPKIEVGDGGRLARNGVTTAPVTIIAFSDFECPFCKRAEETVAQVLSTYGNDLKYVHRDFPLPFHPHAHEAAEAALCAGDQNKYWEYYDKLWKTSDLATASLQQLATDLSLDRTKFDDCLSKDTHSAKIDADVAAGSDVGVNGTPAFFINGRMLSGAQPFEKFKEIIDAELARAKSTATN